NFTQNKDLYSAIDNSVKKTIYEDIGTIKRYRSTNLVTIERLLNFVINTNSGEISVQKLARLLDKDFDTVSNYLEALEEAGLVYGIYNNSTRNSFARNPEKTLPSNANIMTARRIPLLEGDKIGKFREVFAISHIANSIGMDKVRNTKSGDFLVEDKYYIEVGGQNKNLKQVGNVEDGFLFTGNSTSVDLSGRKIPLYLLGLLY
ncbi:MAG: hypothetical protein ACOCXP_02240, partial [Candidatus Dojkabacteria bacterium]